jgi:mono/diheme cytochrome c family protein
MQKTTITKRRSLIAIGFLVITAAIAGCAYSKKEVVQAPCIIADSVYYTANIAPVIASNCASCHSAASNVSGILLDNYDGLQYWAKNGYLYGTISHSSGFKPMPDGGAKLSDCTISLIKRWIDNGSPK